MRHLHRRLIAAICLGTLLFLQIAVTAYACVPVAQDIFAYDAYAVNVPLPCHEVISAPSKLCEQHCVQDARSADTSGANATPAVPMRVGLWLPLLTTELSSSADAHSVAYPPATDPPPHLRFGVLRL